MPNYSLHIDTLIGWALPNALRRPKLYAYLRALASPLKWLHNRLLGLRSDALFRIQTNGQVCYLRGALNRKFDPVLNRIYIEDGIEVGSVFIFNESENSPLYLAEFLSSSDGDFVVWCPVSLQPQEALVSSMVAAFKLVSKSYSIKYFA